MRTFILYLCFLLTAHTTFAATDSTWIAQVRTLRDAIYQRDKAKAAPFFSPSEKLFDSKFDRQFNKEFISSFLKIKTKELFEKGETATADFTNDNIHFYKMVASYEAATLTLEVNYAVRQADDGKYHDSDGGYSYISIFKFINGQLLFEDFVIAG